MEDKVDPEISLIYGIVNFGKVGMELLHPGKPRMIFNTKKTQIENWLDAVEYAKENMYYTPKHIVDPTSGSGSFLKEAADSLTQNPPYSGKK